MARDERARALLTRESRAEHSGDAALQGGTPSTQGNIFANRSRLTSIVRGPARKTRLRSSDNRSQSQPEEVFHLAKNRMTFEKQLRETKKRQKAAAKRESRRRQKDEPISRVDFEPDRADAGQAEADETPQ